MEQIALQLFIDRLKFAGYRAIVLHLQADARVPEYFIV